MKRIEAGESLAAHLGAGGELILGAGVHVASLMPEASVTLRGEPGAVLEGAGGACIQVDVDGIEVTLENLTLRRGHAEAGGGACLTGWSTLRLVGCRVEDCSASEGGGGGAFAFRGRLSIEGCTFAHNRGRFGGDLVASGASEVSVRGGHLHGDVAAREGATLRLDEVRIDGQVDVRGTTTRAPTVVLHESNPAGGVSNDATLPGTVSDA